MEIQGTIIAVCPLNEGNSKNTGKPWKSQDYVLEYRVAERYIHKFVFNLFGDEIEKNNLQVGEVVKVHYDTDASEYGDRYFGKNSAWKVEKIGVVNVAPQPLPQPTTQPNSNTNVATLPPPTTAELFPEGAQKDDLPF